MSKATNQQTGNAIHSRQYLNTQLAEEITNLLEHGDHLKTKYSRACVAATTLEELSKAQRERIDDLEGWLRDICEAKSINEVRRIAHEALW